MASLVNPSVIGAGYTPPWEPEKNSVYPVENQRYKKLNEHPQWEAISKAISAGGVSLEKLLTEAENLSEKAIEVYHQSIVQYPQAFIPTRLGLGSLNEKYC